jgi:eukaryotic-like serine/threonine-protein kinase
MPTESDRDPQRVSESMMTTSPAMIAERYRLLRPLAEGGMGRVWLAEDEVLHRQVAVKEVVPQEGLTPADLKEIRPRTIREARAAARLSHPHVVKVFDIVVTETAPWIVMEYLPSRSLGELVADDGPVPPRRAAQIGLAVLAALTAAHRVGVTHRDVKPGNVLLAEDGRIVLTDFGLATIVGDPAVTRSGVILGSPSYMAPERVTDTGAGPAADLWSLGATLYFAVEGRSPYERGTTLATLAALATEDPPPAPHAGPLGPVIEGLLRRDPSARTDVATLEQSLRAIAAPAVPRQRPAATRTKPAAAAPVAAPASPAPVKAIPAGERPRPYSRLVALLALVILLVIALWSLSPILTRDKTPARSSGGPAPTSAAAPPEPTTASPQPTAGPGELGDSGEPALPAGWHTYTDKTGFSVAVPSSWTVSREGSIVYFREPGGGRVLGIDQTDQPKANPVADWRGQEAYRVARGDFPSYHRVRLAAVDYFRKAADWEFTYVTGGQRMHVNNRGFVTSSHQAYGMWWSTPDSRWDRYLPDLRLIQSSFTPAR